LIMPYYVNPFLRTEGWAEANHSPAPQDEKKFT
jgi:hypothetical protein